MFKQAFSSAVTLETGLLELDLCGTRHQGPNLVMIRRARSPSMNWKSFLQQTTRLLPFSCIRKLKSWPCSCVAIFECANLEFCLNRQATGLLSIERSSARSDNGIMMSSFKWNWHLPGRSCIARTKPFDRSHCVFKFVIVLCADRHHHPLPSASNSWQNHHATTEMAGSWAKGPGDARKYRGDEKARRSVAHGLAEAAGLYLLLQAREA